MPKRNRTKQRFDDMYALAVASHTNNWPYEQTANELADLLARNADLVDEKARKVARDEFWDMAHVSLRGALPRIRQLTQELMAREAAGTKLRFQHEFFKICRQARKEGLPAALRTIERLVRQ